MTGKGSEKRLAQTEGGGRQKRGRSAAVDRERDYEGWGRLLDGVMGKYFVFTLDR